jgi:hypothetical protein
MLAVILSAVYLYISEYQAPFPNPPPKKRRILRFFFSTQKTCPVGIAGQSFKSKTDNGLKTEVQI